MKMGDKLKGLKGLEAQVCDDKNLRSKQGFV